jgi:hypothetical protein
MHLEAVSYTYLYLEFNKDKQGIKMNIPIYYYDICTYPLI